MLRFFFDTGWQHTEALVQAYIINEIIPTNCDHLTFCGLQVENNFLDSRAFFHCNPTWTKILYLLSKTWSLSDSPTSPLVSRLRQTRNQKHHLEGNAIPAGCNAKCCATWLELLTISIVTVGSIWHKLGVRLLTFWKISTAVLRIVWRHLPTGLRNV